VTKIREHIMLDWYSRNEHHIQSLRRLAAVDSRH